MLINIQEQSPAIRYIWMTQTVVPRPIAWILTENDEGNYNLAPFSYFNALCSDPPLVGVSMMRKPAGDVKDTLHNIRARKRFTVHIATISQLTDLNNSALTLDYGASEIDKLNLQTVPFGEVVRLEKSPIAMLCELHQEIALDKKDNQKMILGEIMLLHIDDDIIAEDKKARPVVDIKKLAPIARLSAGNYANLGDIITLERVK